MYRVVSIFVVWSIAVSFYYFFDFWPLSFIAFGGALLARLSKCLNSENESNVELHILIVLSVGTVLPTLNELETSYIYSIVISCLYLACLGWFALKPKKDTVNKFNEKYKYETIVKALSATTLLVTSIIVAYTTELYSLIPSGLLVVGLFIEKIGCNCGKARAQKNPATSQVSNQEQEHLFGINAL
jgi:hypothetical protein